MTELENNNILVYNKLSNININEGYELLRKIYFNDKIGINKHVILNKLLLELSTNIHKARFEDFIIKITTAYNGYRFYLPNFMDFRGRIYRS